MPVALGQPSRAPDLTRLDNPAATRVDNTWSPWEDAPAPPPASARVSAAPWDTASPAPPYGGATTVLPPVPPDPGNGDRARRKRMMWIAVAAGLSSLVGSGARDGWPRATGTDGSLKGASWRAAGRSSKAAGAAWKEFWKEDEESRKGDCASGNGGAASKGGGAAGPDATSGVPIP